MAEVARSAIPWVPVSRHSLRWLGPVVFYLTIPGTPGRFFQAPVARFKMRSPGFPGGNWGIAGARIVLVGLFAATPPSFVV